MRKTIYLHIGSSKTGTSSLQHFLHEHRDWLKASGCLVPESEVKGHHPLAVSIIRGFTGYRGPWNRNYKGNHETLWARFRKEVKGSSCPVVLVSSELFRQLVGAKWRDQTGEMLQWLGRQLADFDVRVVCYLRPLGEHVKSHYKHLVKVGNKDTLADWIEYNIARDSIHTSPDTFLNAFADEFGKENMILRRYDKASLVNGNTIDDFLDLVGLPPQAWSATSKQSNVSLPNDLVDTKRIFNNVSGAPRRKSKQVGVAMAQEAATSYAARPADDGQAIHDALQAEHRKLAENYGLDLGEVGDPFSDTAGGSVEQQGQTVLLSTLFNEIRESQKTLNELRKEVAKLRAEGDDESAK